MIEESYWRLTAAPAAVDKGTLPATAEIVVIGGGITGLSAALELARAGRDVVLIEAGPINHGATNRNFGALGESLKPSFTVLCERYGRERAIALCREARSAFDALLDFLRAEGIRCGFRRTGRLVGIGSATAFAAAAREQEARAAAVGGEVEILGPDRIADEIGSSAFHGGYVIPYHATVHPGELHAALVKLCVSAGVRLFENSRVGGIVREGGRSVVTVGTWRISTSEVVVATNGYTGPATPWLRRRLIPIDAFLVATEPLDPALVARLLPTGRFFVEAHHNPRSARISPDGTRMILGGQTGASPRRLAPITEAISRSMAEIFPELSGVRLSCGWTGRCAGGFDLLPFVARQDGITYVGGYCFGSGLPLGFWLGRKASLRILGSADAETAFANDEPATRFYYSGTPWFRPFLRMAARFV